jgi:hypothetical protein
MRALWWLTVLWSLPLPAQLEKLSEQLGQLGKRLPVAEIALRTEPADRRVRPLETLVIQVLAYGKDGEQKVRLRRSGARLRVKEPDGGWLSKSFAFQGKDEEKFFEESKSAAWNVFADTSGQFVMKDSVLYTAPEKAGKYRIEAELEGKQAEVEIEVSPEAAARRKPEKVSFPAEARRSDPYRPLVEHYAPFLAQETWFEPKADIPSRFDFDGDWHGDNNWDALEEGSSQAFLYYAVMETQTHWFIIYNVFHPRDYSDRCVVGTCHENDNEGIILTVLKDGSALGRLLVMETLAHNNVYSVTADAAIRNGAHTIDGRIEFYQQTHPAVFVESGGHGIYGTGSANSRFSFERGEFQEGTGITLSYKGAPERPRHANERLVGYELLPIYEEWWPKAEEGKWNDRTFDSYFRYQPFGGRPGVAASIGGAFFGRKESSNKAKPFWGWHDTLTLKKGILAVGQWALDPAYGVSQNLRFPPGQPFSLDYVYNPFLGIDRREQKAAPEQPPATVTVPAPAQPEHGQVDIEVQVDGTVDICLTGDKVRWEVQSGQPVARESAKFSAPLPSSPAGSWSLGKLAGRGRATLLEKPSAENGYTAKIRVEDPRGGADLYRLRLQWNR